MQQITEAPTKRKINQGVTKEYLIQQGFSITQIGDNEYSIKRYSCRGRSSEYKWREIKTAISIGKHKYAGDKKYPVVNWSDHGKVKTLPLARLLYAYYIQDIPDGYQIDHIDNDPFNNRLENLEMLTVEQNNRKRFIDNPDTKFMNQYTYINRGKK